MAHEGRPVERRLATIVAYLGIGAEPQQLAHARHSTVEGRKVQESRMLIRQRKILIEPPRRIAQELRGVKILAARLGNVDITLPKFLKFLSAVMYV